MMMQEKNTFILTLNSKDIKIPLLFKSITQINPTIYQSLVINHQYQVKSSVDEQIFTSFLDFLIYDKDLLISSESIQSNIQLRDCYKSLIESCWSQEPEKRPQIDNVLSDSKNKSRFLKKRS